MVRERDDLTVVWPRYFDGRITRSDGRRVAEDLAVDDPDARTIAKAVEDLGYDVTLDPDACHPARPWDATGRVLVTGADNKEELLQEVGRRLVDGG